MKAGVLCALVLALAGCKGRAPARKVPAGVAQIRVTDDSGHTLTLARPARRVASLSPSNTEILYAIGCGARVVLRDKVSSYPPAVRRLPATSPFYLSAEHVAGFKPDLVLLSHADAAQVGAMRRVGLAVATFDPRSMAQIYASIHAVGKLCGASTRARTLTAAMARQVQAVRRRVSGRPRPTVYIETDGADPLKPWTAGPGSFVDYLLTLAGGHNLVARLKRPYVQINAEEVLAGDPDQVLLMGVSGKTRGKGLALLRARPGWSGLRAVRQGKVIDTIHPDLISRPGPRITSGLAQLARALHPTVK